MLLICLCALLARSYLTHCDPIDCSPPGSSVHGILQGKTWVGCHSILQEILQSGIEPRPSTLQEDSLLSDHQGSLFTSSLLICLLLYYFSFPRKIPWRREWQRIPVFLPVNPTYRGAWWATGPWDHKKSDTTEWLSPVHLNIDSITQGHYLRENSGLFLRFYSMKRYFMIIVIIIIIIIIIIVYCLT